MTQTVTVPGVGDLEFPDGMSQPEMAAAIQKNYPQIHAPQKLSPAALAKKIKADVAAKDAPDARAARFQQIQADNVAHMSTFDKVAAGAGKAIYDTGRGIGELIGKVSTQDIAASRQADQALMATGAGKVGNVLGYVGEALPAAILAPTAGLGAGAAIGTKMAVGGALGGAQGYAQPYASTGEHVVNTLAGAGLGAIIPGTGAAVGKVVNGLATPEARALAAEGVRLTPGQMIGGHVKRAEDALTSVPIVGGAIRAAQQRSLESFDRAAVNRVIAPLGAVLPDHVSGRAALIVAQKAVSDAYNSTLDQMKGKVDQTFANNIGQLWNKYGKNLPAKEGDELGSYIQNDVLRKFDQAGNASGKIVHEIQSDLGAQASKLMRSDDLGRRQLGQAVKDLQGHVKDMLKRNNSADLNRNLQNATNSFRQLVRVNKAAGMIGAHDGIFTPAQLRSAVRATDSTRNKAAFTQGRAEMQDLAERAQGVLPSKIPDSGTAGRLMTAGALGTGAVTGHIAPMVAAGAAAHAIYSPVGQSIIQRALMPRQSPVSNYLANLAIKRFGAPANALAAPAMMPAPVPQQ